MPRLEFWFEFGSTYTYPAAMRIERLARITGVGVDWRPFLLGPIFRDLGWSDSPFNLQPAKGRYMWRDLERTCAALAIPFVRPAKFPRNGLLAARVTCWFDSEPWMPAFAQAVFRANFAEDREIADPEVVLACLNGLGLDGSRVLAQAQTGRARRSCASRPSVPRISVFLALRLSSSARKCSGAMTGWNKPWRGRNPVRSRRRPRARPSPTPSRAGSAGAGPCPRGRRVSGFPRYSAAPRRRR